MKTQKQSTKSKAKLNQLIAQHRENYAKKREAFFEEDPGRVWFEMLPPLIRTPGEPEIAVAVKIALSGSEWIRLHAIARDHGMSLDEAVREAIVRSDGVNALESWSEKPEVKQSKGKAGK